MFKTFLDEQQLTEGKTLASKVKGVVIGDLLSAIYSKVQDEPFKNKDISDILSQFNMTNKDASNLFFALKKDGLINSPTKGQMQIPANVAADIQKDYQKGVQADTEKVAKTKAIKNIGTTKTVKFKVPKVSSGSKYLDQMVTLLDHMDSSADGITKKTYMLAGDPGTGKTSFIESLGTLTGIPLVVIEAPHITQEHLINIPFLVIDGHKRTEGNIAIADHDKPESFKIVQAESALVTTLKSKKRRTDDQVQKFINQNKVLRDIQPKLQYEIDLVKKRYNSILFLDEFYRTTSKKIRNVLRNILNGKIGDDKIPAGTYIIMATNINDEGIDDIPENHDFNLMKYDTPDKEDLFNYFYGKYVDNPEEAPETYDPEASRTRSGISIKPEVFNGFFENVRPEDLGKNDEDADVRLSPRRLEQMLIYVDSQTPCKDQKEAEALISYITTSLSNYLEDGEAGKSEMVEPYVKIVKDIIKETSNLSEGIVDALKPMGKTDWGYILDAQIDAKLKLGDSKKYVPVVSGDPGIGKTSAAVEIARERNMGFIQIDVSNRSAEDFSGMPNADMTDENITVEFTEPALYRLIMSEYNHSKMPGKYKNASFTDGQWVQDGNIIEPGEKPDYKVILLFDEMNRTSPAVFNSMRKILLEKQFSDSYMLPPDIMMMGAINPKGEGTMEFTSHTRDVLDIIPASASFSDVMNYAQNVDKIKDINDTMGFDLSGTVAKTLSMLGDDFHSERNSVDDDARELEPGEQPFWWNLNGQIVYISGREFTEALFEIVVKTQKSFRRMGWDVNTQFSEEEYDKFIEEAINIFAKYLGMGLNMVVVKMAVEDFVPTLQGRIINDGRIRNLYKIIKDKRSKGEVTLARMLEKTNYSEKPLGKGVIGDYIKYMTPTQMTGDMSQVINALMQDKTPLEAMEKVMTITKKLKKSFKESGANFEYIDKLNKRVKGEIVVLIDNGNLPLVSVMKDTKLMSEIEQLVS